MPPRFVITKTRNFETGDSGSQNGTLPDACFGRVFYAVSFRTRRCPIRTRRFAGITDTKSNFSVGSQIGVLQRYRF